MLAFAKEKGWTCSKSKPVSSTEVAAWVYRQEPVFPLIFGENNVHTEDMKRHIDGSAILIRCDSGWIRVDPGSAESSTAFGYILLSTDGARMAVYHFWGEG